MTRVHPLRPDEDSLSPHLLLSALYIQRMQMKLWACLIRNIWEFANVSICRLLPQKIISDTKNCANISSIVRNTKRAPEIYTAPSRGIGLTTEITTSLYTCCFILHDIGPICCYHFDRGFPPSQSMHSDLWIKSRVHLERLKSRRVNRFGAQIGCHSSTEPDGVQNARAAGEGYLKLHLTAKSGVMLLVFQILQERSIITPLKNLAVGQF